MARETSAQAFESFVSVNEDNVIRAIFSLKLNTPGTNDLRMLKYTVKYCTQICNYCLYGLCLEKIGSYFSTKGR